MPYFSLFEQVLATSSVKTSSDINIPPGCHHAELQAECENVRYTMDGMTNPSQTTGMLLAPTGQPKAILVEDLIKIRFTRGAASDGSLKLHYQGGTIPAGSMTHREPCVGGEPMMAMIAGLTYTIADAFTGFHGTGTHWHSTNVVPAPFPSLPSPAASGYAEVGGFFGDENCRGFSEFDFDGAPGSVTSATLKFQVADMVALGVTPGPAENGLFDQGTLAADVEVYGYTGNNVEDLADYTASGTLLGEFDTTGLSVDDQISLDVTAYVNTLLGAAADALGIRLQMKTEDPDAEAMTFDRFMLDLEW